MKKHPEAASPGVISMIRDTLNKAKRNKISPVGLLV